MIKDYHEIVTEAGRLIGYSRKNKGKKNVPIEDLPEKEPMRPRGSYIQLLDKLNPLYRFLLSRVGKSWDKTYSDISKLNFDNVSGVHIKSHINQWVEQNAIIRFGKPYHPVEGRYFRPQHVSEREFWVDENKILRRGWKIKPKEYAQDPYTFKYKEITYWILDSGLIMTYNEDISIVEEGYYKRIFRPYHNFIPWKMGKLKEFETFQKNNKEIDCQIGPFKAVYNKIILKFAREHREKYE